MTTKFQQRDGVVITNNIVDTFLQALYYLASISFTISNFSPVNADVPPQDAW